MFPVQKSVLLRTSSLADFQYSDGTYTIAGARVRKSDIRQVRQIKYRANTAQVVTIGSNSYTPTASTTYQVLIGTPQRKTNGNANALLPYSYRTPADLTTLGATAALQREAINLAVVAAINLNATALKVTAASLLTGTGFTITDTGSYYGPRTTAGTDNFFGATTIAVKLDSNGNGWVNTVSSTAAATAIVYTTPAVYWSGVGANLAADVPVVDPMFGNIVSGMTTGQALFNAPAPLTTAGLPAVSGQNYDLYLIDHLVRNVPIPSVSNITGFAPAQTFIFVDQGTGTATTNLAGFITFDHEFHKLLFSKDFWGPSSVTEFFDDNFIIQGPLGAVPTTTTSTNNAYAVYNTFSTKYDTLNHFNIGTQTIVAPTQGLLGLLIDQDINTGDGNAYMPSLVTVNSQQFVVGSQECMVVAKFTATDITKAIFQVGFHEKNVFFLDWNDYVNLASIGLDTAAGAFTTRGILANAATVSTVSSTVAVNSVMSAYMVKVAIDGTVSCYANGVKYPVYSTGTTPLIFAAGTVLIPWFQQTSITGTAGVGTISEFVSVDSAQVIL